MRLLAALSILAFVGLWFHGGTIWPNHAQELLARYGVAGTATQHRSWSTRTTWGEVTGCDVSGLEKLVKGLGLEELKDIDPRHLAASDPSQFASEINKREESDPTYSKRQVWALQGLEAVESESGGKWTKADLANRRLFYLAYRPSTLKLSDGSAFDYLVIAWDAVGNSFVWVASYSYS